MANDATIHIAVSRTAVCFAEITAPDCAMPSRPHRDARMLKEDKHSARQWVSLSINPREHSTSQLLSEAARNTSLSVTWLALVRSLRSRKTDTDCIEILVRKSRTPRHTSSHFISVMRFSTGRERRQFVKLILVTFAANACRRSLLASRLTEHYRSPLCGLDDPRFSERKLFTKILCHDVFVLNGLRYPFPSLCFPLAVHRLLRLLF